MEEKFSLNILWVLDKAHSFWEFRDPRKQNFLCPLKFIIQIFSKCIEIILQSNTMAFSCQENYFNTEE